jgi:hypothetical protein
MCVGKELIGRGLKGIHLRCDSLEERARFMERILSFFSEQKIFQTELLWDLLVPAQDDILGGYLLNDRTYMCTWNFPTGNDGGLVFPSS